MSSKLERYIGERMGGAGSLEAARRAGYSGGRPPSSAVRLWRLVSRVRGNRDEVVSWAHQRIERAERELREARELVAAVDLLDGGSS